MDTLRCQIGALGLSLKLPMKIVDLPTAPVQGPFKIFWGEQKGMFASSPKFLGWGGATAPLLVDLKGAPNNLGPLQKVGPQ